jgi:pimeloyl-ACP methyl ester carboxylesterase
MQRRDALKFVAAGAALAGSPGGAAGKARPARVPFVETADGNRLFYRDVGAGKPVVFVHGWSLNSDIWEYQIAELAGADLRCVAYDKRGCGRSTDYGSRYDHDTLADDLAAVLEQLDLKSVTLVGHSMGAGEIARYLSRRGTRRVAGVVLVAPITPYALKTADNPEGLDREYFDGQVAELKKDRPRYLVAGAPGFFGVGASVSAEMVDWGVHIALQSSMRAAIGMMVENVTTDFRPDLRAFKVPTLIVHGSADLSAPVELTARRTARGIPGCLLEVYEGAGHAPFLTEKERFNRDLLAFARDGRLPAK